MSGIPADRCKMPQAFWRAFSDAGVKPAAILRQARLPATLHLNPHVFLSTAQIFAIYRAVEELVDDPGFAIKFVKAFDRSGHQPAFLAACYAADYRDALGRIDRFKRLSTCETFVISEQSGEVTVSKEWPYSPEPEPALSIDVSFAFVIELGRKGTGQRITPVRVDLARAGPRSLDHETFFGCPIRYGSPRNLLVMRSSDLDRPFPGRNSEFLDLLTPALAAARKDLEAESTFSEQVKIVLKRSLASGRPDVSNIARELGTSERTLQRRITEEGTTFREILAAARQELGEHLLLDSSISIDEVAILLGYQDTSSFYRAFKERQGVTPHNWRERNGERASLH
ncbi:AraC family transcriptional regulator ligand-binding domain-containing protein [Roseiarcaceae bacterium H3SJ34-1]|uniref:AraC family transcriptional regulator n=1 Tax=Terripilifer ovatus TaxID=3032367 RepID=UPI003AB9523D|nr:AraC family transcriptional regulator ligand-binding domain-containing protein [Roseiarcaceae bacterium H3SJ34-1]